MFQENKLKIIVLLSCLVALMLVYFVFFNNAEEKVVEKAPKHLAIIPMEKLPESVKIKEEKPKPKPKPKKKIEKTKQWLYLDLKPEDVKVVVYKEINGKMKEFLSYVNNKSKYKDDGIELKRGKYMILIRKKSYITRKIDLKITSKSPITNAYSIYLDEQFKADWY